MKSLVSIYKNKQSLKEDDNYWEEELFLPNERGDDDDDKEEKKSDEYDEQCNDCIECGNLPECEECIEALHEELELPVIEQNTTASIAGYMMPLGSKRPSITDIEEPYDLLDEPKEKEKIKILDKGPNPDRTYKKLNWDKLNKKNNEHINISLKLRNMF